MASVNIQPWAQATSPDCSRSTTFTIGAKRRKESEGDRENGKDILPMSSPEGSGSGTTVENQELQREVALISEVPHTTEGLVTTKLVVKTGSLPDKDFLSPAEEGLSASAGGARGSSTGVVSDGLDKVQQKRDWGMKIPLHRPIDGTDSEYPELLTSLLIAPPRIRRKFLRANQDDYSERRILDLKEQSGSGGSRQPTSGPGRGRRRRRRATSTTAPQPTRSSNRLRGRISALL